MSRSIVIVGAGNAALCSAISAAECGARVLVLERAPRDCRGGNSAFTGGAFRTVHDGAEDIRRLAPKISTTELGRAISALTLLPSRSRRTWRA